MRKIVSSLALMVMVSISSISCKDTAKEEPDTEETTVVDEVAPTTEETPIIEEAPTIEPATPVTE